MDTSLNPAEGSLQSPLLDVKDGRSNGQQKLEGPVFTNDELGSFRFSPSHRNLVQKLASNNSAVSSVLTEDSNGIKSRTTGSYFIFVSHSHFTQYNVEKEAEYPYFIYMMLLVNAAVFIAELAVAGWEIAPLSVNPMVGPGMFVLVQMGAKDSFLMVDEGQWWRLITPTFLHAGLLHLGMNMVAVLQMGRQLELNVGTFRVASIYILAGVSGVVWSCVFLPNQIGVGASGAIMGLLGALVGDFILHHQYMGRGKWRYFSQLMLVSIASMLLGLMPLVDNFCHVTGWITGFLASLFFFTGAVEDPITRKRTYRVCPALGSLVLLVAMFVVGASLLFSGTTGGDWCPICAKMNCIQTPWWDCDLVS
eukprot:g76838.t1